MLFTLPHEFPCAEAEKMNSLGRRRIGRHGFVPEVARKPPGAWLTDHTGQSDRGGNHVNVWKSTMVVPIAVDKGPGRDFEPGFYFPPREPSRERPGPCNDHPWDSQSGRLNVLYELDQSHAMIIDHCLPLNFVRILDIAVVKLKSIRMKIACCTNGTIKLDRGRPQGNACPPHAAVEIDHDVHGAIGLSTRTREIVQTDGVVNEDGEANILVCFGH